MSRLEKFFGKPVDREIGGEVFTFEPFKSKDLDLFMKFQEGGGAEQIHELVYRALVIHQQDVTLDEVKQMPIGALSQFITTIVEVNGLDDKSNQPSKLGK